MNNSIEDLELNNVKVPVFKTLMGYLKNHKMDLLIVFISVIFTSLSTLMIGKGIGYLIDEGFKSGSMTVLNEALILLLCLIILLSIATYFRSSTINKVAEEVIAKIRLDIYKKVITLPIAFFEINKTSDILSRITGDSLVLSNVIATVSSFTIRNIIIVIGGLILLFSTSVKLTLYVIVLVPLVLLPIIISGKKVRRLAKMTMEKTSVINVNIEESLNNIKTLFAFNHEEKSFSDFKQDVTDAERVAIKRIKARAKFVALVMFAVFASIAFVLWIGSKDVLSGEMSAGELSAFIFYSVFVAGSFASISEAVSELNKATAASERLFQLLYIENTSSDEGENLSDKQVSIKFEDVNFAYPARPEVLTLKNFSLTINPGEKIAIAGSSGAGKTTIFQLLLKFYRPLYGSIKLDDLDINNISTKSLRSHIAIVPQDPVIFSSTAYENIVYGNIDASIDQVEEAAKHAEIYDFLSSLPKGFDTFLGEKGVRVSGGQKQRIAIARAIIKNPSILLLDEATSSLDSENEKLVQKALEKVMKNRTTIIIAHRISTITSADRIILMDKGEINDIGTHHELLERNELYQRLALSYGS